MRRDAMALCGLGSTLLVIGVAGFVAAGRFAGAPTGQKSAVATSDFDAELAGIDQELAACATADTEQRATQLAFLQYRRASLIGDAASFLKINSAIDAAIHRYGPSADLCLLKSNVDFKFHRLAEAKEDLNGTLALAQSVRGRALLADLAFQQGDCNAAGAGYESVVADDPTWDNLSRLAYYKSKRADFAAADRAHCEAADEISVKDARNYAWVQLQYGLSHFARGHYDEAEAAYKRAARAYSGYWLVDEYTAELLAARKQYDQAIQLYQNAIARTARPDVLQELGDVYAFMGKPDQAKPWHDRALAGYLDSVRRGEVQYFHHLAGFYSDSRHDPSEAIKWAQKDLRLRRNYMTEDALAWALYQAGRFAEAETVSTRALGYGMSDAHVSFHAAMIRLAAGHPEEGRRLLQRTAEINPHFGDFHVHR